MTEDKPKRTTRRKTSAEDQPAVRDVRALENEKTVRDRANPIDPVTGAYIG